jgi:hypothetical protein
MARPHRDTPLVFLNPMRLGHPCALLLIDPKNVNPTTITLLQSHYYHSTLAPSTLIILFSKVLKFSIFVIYNKKKQDFVMKIIESSKIFDSLIENFQIYLFI